MSESYYDVLGVPESAGQEEIRAAYREKVKEYHPDVSDRDDAADRFKAVTRAEEVLGDETERARYDRLGHDAYVRHLDGGNAATNERSPWTADDGSEGGGPNAAGAGSQSTRERAREAAGAGDDDGPSQHRRQRRRRRYHERKAATAQGTAGSGAGAGSTGASGGSTADTAGETTADAAGETTAHAGSSTGGDGSGSTYAVHDWEPADRSFIGGRPSLTHDTLVQTLILGLLYPALLYSSVTPEFPLLVNLVVGGLTLVLIGYLITLPLVGGAVFGVWSVLAPLAMTSMGFELLSVPVVVAALGCWIPLGYSVTVALVLRW